MPIPDNLDEEKLAEAALAILSLTRMVEPYGVTAWKGIDWDVMNMLCSGLIEPDTLIRDNIYQLLRCQNGAKTNEQTVF